MILRLCAPAESTALPALNARIRPGDSIRVRVGAWRPSAYLQLICSRRYLSPLHALNLASRNHVMAAIRQTHSMELAAADRFNDRDAVLPPALAQLARGIERLFRDGCLGRHFKPPSNICLLSFIFTSRKSIVR